MSNVFGTLYKVSIFGESHSAAIGVVIDGIPAGTPVDMEQIAAAMARRAPNSSAASTKRREADAPEILSGLFEGKATGTPLAAVIRNSDTRSEDYEKMRGIMRPGHADYTGYAKYGGWNDYRGGGHFSGRLTAPLVFAGNVAAQYLNSEGIYCGAHIQEIGDILDQDFAEYSKEYLQKLENKSFYTVDDNVGRDMQELIGRTARESDSIGGVVECAVCGDLLGLGEPFFDSVESVISHILFSIPAVKGVAFGTGFALAEMKGSEANDIPCVDGGSVGYRTNHNGGVNGGIANGAPIVFRVAIKATPSISKTQQSVDFKEKKDVELRISGRHDACIVPRAVEVVKSAANIALMDLYLRNKGE